MAFGGLFGGKEKQWYDLRNLPPVLSKLKPYSDLKIFLSSIKLEKVVYCCDVYFILFDTRMRHKRNQFIHFAGHACYNLEVQEHGHG